jgi:hypothetical protein
MDFQIRSSSYFQQTMVVFGVYKHYQLATTHGQLKQRSLVGVALIDQQHKCTGSGVSRDFMLVGPQRGPIKVCLSTPKLGGSGGMLPQEIF